MNLLFLKLFFGLLWVIFYHPFSFPASTPWLMLGDSGQECGDSVTSWQFFRVYPNPLPKAAGVGSNLLQVAEDGFQDVDTCTFVPVATRKVLESLEEFCGLAFTRFIHFMAL